jgi:RNA-directed DNA polymerase
MTKAPISLQELQRRIYRKAKSDSTHRFWGIFVHITKMETLQEAYRQAKKNGGAPGIDGKRFDDVEQEGVIPFLETLQEELQTGRYTPQPTAKSTFRKETATYGHSRSRQFEIE